MTISVSGSQITFNDASVQNTAATGFGFKNRIINGAMMIDQRNAGASVANSGLSTQYTLDRWNTASNIASKLTIQQSSTAPAGFKNSLLITSSSAYTVATGDYFVVRQQIEGYNLSDMGFGAAGASTFTISFWVRSSLTGTFGAAVMNVNADRSYPFTYTILSANTWEQKTVTIAGDTTGTWNTGNGVGMYVQFGLGVGTTYSGTAGAWATGAYLSATGATSVVGTNGATWYVTGVQLEKGSTATSFDYRPYGTELALCQRYLPTWSNVGNAGATAIGVGQNYSTTQSVVVLPCPVMSRVPATGITVTGSGTNYVYNSTASPIATSSIVLNGSTNSSVQIVPVVASGLVAGNATNLLLGAGNLIYATGCEL